MTDGNASNAEQGDLGALQAAVRSLGEDVKRLKTLNERINAPKRYIIIALFTFKDEKPPELEGLAAGETAGLPLVMHDWCPMEPCRTNVTWRKNARGAATAPPGWTYTHVGARSFASRYEADYWLAHSPEGEFLTRHAQHIMAVAVTDYATY
jgi:hypothetical protein